MVKSNRFPTFPPSVDVGHSTPAVENMVVSIPIREFSALVEKAKTAELLVGGKGGHFQKRPYAEIQQSTENSSEVQAGARNIKCFRCGGPHYVGQCPRKGMICFNCQKPGHVARDCKLKVKAASSRNVSKPKKSKGGSSTLQSGVKGIKCFRCGESHHVNQCPHKRIICFKCRKSGHIARDCGMNEQTAPVMDMPKQEEPKSAGRIFEMSGAEVSKSDEIE